MFYLLSTFYNMISNFKALNLGIRRILIVGTIPGALIIGSIIDSKEFILAGLLFGIPVYWLTIFIILWVVDGFKKEA